MTPTIRKAIDDLIVATDPDSRDFETFEDRQVLRALVAQCQRCLNTSGVGDAALAQRLLDIKKLQACLCNYPKERYRNGSGHRSSCPAHALHVAAWEAQEAAREGRKG